MSNLYGFLGDTAGFGIGYPIIGANSITFSEGDALYINTSGFLDLATTSSQILGFSVDTLGTLASNNQTVGLVCPKYVEAAKVLMVYPTSDASSFAQTNLGEYYVLSSNTSGAMTINPTSSATTGQFILRGFGPDGGTVGQGTSGTASNGVFECAAIQTNAPSGA